MGRIITDFSKWKKLNEGLFWDVVEKEPLAGTTHKIKVKYLDATSFKVKAVNDLDMTKPDGTIDPTIMDGIVYFLKTQDGIDFAREYPTLQNLATFYKDGFFTYNVKKENDRRQVIVFTLQKRANFKDIDPGVKVISDDIASGKAQTADAKNALAKSDQLLLQITPEDQSKKKRTPGKITLQNPILIASIVQSDSNSTFFKLFDNIVAAMATSKLFKDSPAINLINKTIDELEAKKLGENSVKLVKALIAGCGGATFVDKYGRTKEQTHLTQDVLNKILLIFPAAVAQNSSKQYHLGLGGKMIFEADSILNSTSTQTNTPDQTALAGFDMAAFSNAITGGTTTEDIKLPANGLKKGTVAKGDAELQKVQKLIIDKLSPVLGDNPTFKKFVSYGTDGDYGPTTEKVIAMVKAGFELKDQDSTTITPELINKLLTDKITESYLGLNGRLFEKFNVEAAQKVSSSYVPTKKAETKNAEIKKEEVKTDAKKDETSNDANNLANEIIELLRSASTAVVNLYNDSDFFSEYNDDEDAAVSDIFGKDQNDKSSWWYSNIWKKYIESAVAKHTKLISQDSTLGARVDKEVKKVGYMLYAKLKDKTSGGTFSDEYSWSVLGLDGKKTSYKVDTDF